MARITRAVTPKELEDLLTSANIAIVAWGRERGSGRYCIGVPPGTLAEHTEVAALVDDGPLCFDLRGVRVRGRLGAPQYRQESQEFPEYRTKKKES